MPEPNCITEMLLSWRGNLMGLKSKHGLLETLQARYWRGENLKNSPATRQLTCIRGGHQGGAGALPGPGAGEAIGRALTYVAVSDGITRLMHEYIWAAINHPWLPYLLMRRLSPRKGTDPKAKSRCPRTQRVCFCVQSLYDQNISGCVRQRC